MKLLSISTEHGERDPHVIEQYDGGSKTLVMKITALKIKKVKDEYAVLITNTCKQFLSKIFVRVLEKFFGHFVQCCNSFASVTEQ